MNPLQNFRDAMKRGIPFYDMVEVVLGANAVGSQVLTNQDGRSFFITDIINCSFVTASRVPTSDFLFQLTDSGANYQMSYTKIHGYALGSNKVATKLEIPYVLRPTSDLKFDFTNNSATPITVQLVVKGYKIAPSSLDSDLKNLGMTFWDMFDVTLTASQSLKGIINNKDEKTFLIQEYVAYSKLASSGAQTTAFRAYFRDSGSRQPLAQTYISGGMIGNGEFPSRFEVPFALPSQRQFELEVSNDLGGDGQRVFLVVKGVKVPRK